MKIDLDKVLITGSNGMVGSYVDFGIKTARNDFDITNLNQVKEFLKKCCKKLCKESSNVVGKSSSRFPLYCGLPLSLPGTQTETLPKSLWLTFIVN